MQIAKDSTAAGSTAQPNAWGKKFRKIAVPGQHEFPSENAIPRQQIVLLQDKRHDDLPAAERARRSQLRTTDCTALD